MKKSISSWIRLGMFVTCGSCALLIAAALFLDLTSADSGKVVVNAEPSWSTKCSISINLFCSIDPGQHVIVYEDSDCRFNSSFSAVGDPSSDVFIFTNDTASTASLTLNQTTNLPAGISSCSAEGYVFANDLSYQSAINIIRFNVWLSWLTNSRICIMEVDSPNQSPSYWGSDPNCVGSNPKSGLSRWRRILASNTT